MEHEIGGYLNTLPVFYDSFGLTSLSDAGGVVECIADVYMSQTARRSPAIYFLK